MPKDTIFIEPRSAGGFGATHEGGKRAVVTGETQREVVQETKATHRSISKATFFWTILGRPAIKGHEAGRAQL